jgi:hypothetical protein
MVKLVSSVLLRCCAERTDKDHVSGSQPSLVGAAQGTIEACLPAIVLLLVGWEGSVEDERSFLVQLVLLLIVVDWKMADAVDAVIVRHLR